MIIILFFSVSFSFLMEPGSSSYAPTLQFPAHCWCTQGLTGLHARAQESSKSQGQTKATQKSEGKYNYVTLVATLALE